MDNALHTVFVHNLQDIFNSETQITAALPKMRDAAQNPDLKQALTDHLAETQQQVRRIVEVCRILGCPTGNVTCQATAGLVREAEEQMKEFGSGPARDAAIIGCAQKVEHYEIANYGTVIEWAEEMDHDKDAIKLLKETLKEESAANEKLTKIAKHGVNEAAINAQFVASTRATLI
jgi:ferritin-like metal-binding protein YciE